MKIERATPPTPGVDDGVELKIERATPPTPGVHTELAIGLGSMLGDLAWSFQLARRPPQRRDRVEPGEK